MTIDGFSPEDAAPFAGFEADRAARFFRALSRVGGRLHIELTGVEHLPAGGALLVANHAFGWDVAFAVAAIRDKTGRHVWTLGEHAWWAFPYLRRLACSLGVVDGTPANTDELLSRGELVLVLPGGLREAVKPSTLRYRLLWGHRYGFVREAVKHGVPIVPLACFGADDVFDFVGDAYARGRRWLHAKVPLPRPAWFSLPHAVPWRFVLAPPVLPLALPGEQPDATLRRLRREVEGALHELFEQELAAREGVAM